MLLDDFARADGNSRLGTQWRFFADSVMGGASRGNADTDRAGGHAYLRLRGQVSLENNGGFIQAALPLTKGDAVLDARDFSGFRLRVRGNGEVYHLHVRTSDSRRPWQYYSAPFVATNEWRNIDIRFEDLQPFAARSRSQAAIHE